MDMQTLQDLEDIRQLKSRYFRLMDTQQWDTWQHCFTDDISAFYEANGKGLASAAPTPAAVVPPADVQALLGKGNCVACHGEGLNKPIDGSYPKIAGQHADYLYVALKAYQTDHNPQIGRGNAIMATQARMFTHAELKLLAGYVASLPGDLQTVPQPRFR